MAIFSLLTLQVCHFLGPPASLTITHFQLCFWSPPVPNEMLHCVYYPVANSVSFMLTVDEKKRTA